MAAGALIVALAVWRGGIRPHDWPVRSIGLTLIDFFFAAVLCLILARPDHPVTQVVRAPVLQHAGRYSYGLYVFHNLLSPLWARIALTVGDHFDIETGREWIGVVVAMTGSCVAAVVSWHVYERHWLALKARFPRPQTDGVLRASGLREAVGIEPREQSELR